MCEVGLLAAVLAAVSENADTCWSDGNNDFHIIYGRKRGVLCSISVMGPLKLLLLHRKTTKKSLWKQ